MSTTLGGGELCETLPDDAQVLPAVPRWPAPLLHHQHRLSIDQEATEEEGQRGCEQQAHAIEGIVALEAGTVEVKGGVHLDCDRSQQEANAIHHRLGAGLEVLEEHPEPIHDRSCVGTAVGGTRRLGHSGVGLGFTADSSAASCCNED